MYINGRRVKKLYKGSSLVKKIYRGTDLIYVNGQWKSVVLLYRANNTITFPETTKDLVVIVVGAGGCSGNFSTGAAGKPVFYYNIGGSGGGAGGFSQKSYGTVLAGQTVSFTVGTCGSSYGVGGGASIFLSQVANGGAGGAYAAGGWNAGGAAGGAGGTAGGGDINYQGASGTAGAMNGYGTGGGGWTVNGEVFGQGASPNAMNNNVETVTHGIRTGCVYIQYTYFGE